MPSYDRNETGQTAKSDPPLIAAMNSLERNLALMNERIAELESRLGCVISGPQVQAIPTPRKEESERPHRPPAPLTVRVHGARELVAELSDRVASICRYLDV